ncbi:MAG: energy transducer TonB [Bacteroidia bacterium]
MKTSIDQRYENEEKKNRRIGLAGAFGSVGLILAILISFGLYYQVPPPEEIGVSLILGTPDGGMMLEFAELPTSEASSPSNPNPEESLTQDLEDAPSIQTDPSKPNPVTSNTEAEPNPTTRPARTFNNTNRSGGVGDEGGPGNEGDPDGGDKGSPTGTGTGDIGDGLKGRKATFKPMGTATCTLKGEIKVKITVDQRGKVIYAKYVLAGSTTSNSTCVKEAEDLAKRWVFEPAAEGTGNVNAIITIILQ